MSKVKLIKQLKNKNPKLNNLQINFLVDFFSESIADALTKGKNVEIRGLGRWYCKKLKENFNLRNPATSELIYRPERVKIRFRASKKLNKLINE